MNLKTANKQLIVILKWIIERYSNGYPAITLKIVDLLIETKRPEGNLSEVLDAGLEVKNVSQGETLLI